MNQKFKEKFANKKIKIGILCGGRSAEHEVSLLSAKNVVKALDPQRYEVTIIGISKTGQWKLLQPGFWLENDADPKLVKFGKVIDNLNLLPGEQNNQLSLQKNSEPISKLDVVFPVLHGPNGEDGTVQGLLKLMNIPFVGPGVLGSAVGMDKDVMKRLLRDAKIPVANFVSFLKSEIDEIDYDQITSRLGTTVFVKPANLGSSVGISKATNSDEFNSAIDLAFKYDTKILIEEAIKGREIECSVLGNENPIASIPGEIIPKSGFYSFDAKYIDAEGAALEAPAKLSAEMVAKVQRIAIKAFKVLCCEGLSRVDLFLKEDGELLINEINTIPGFTKISMYPKLWEISGIGYSELIDKLVELAIERWERDNELL